MQSQLTVRLSEDLETGITRAARKLRLRRSDIVRMALEKFLIEFENTGHIKPYDRVKSLLGSYASGIQDLGESHRNYLIQRFKRNA
ncbi:MAG: hypothetical protein JSU90_11300 [Nitrospiraceae bacterium]|nr:MAG: hypothetical protein JSU90_11300 [Nitrospiraceae bacterium]